MTSVMPKPPAAFSPLTTTRSSFQSAISPGSRSVTIVRPDRPTTSPMKRLRMPSVYAQIDNLALRSHEIEARVALRCMHARNLLCGKCNSDGSNGLPGAQCINCHVVIARAVTDAVARTIKGSQRHDENVGRNLRCLRQRLADAPLAGRQRFAESPCAHDQSLAASGNRWQRETRPGIGELAHQRDRIDFALHRREGGDD